MKFKGGILGALDPIFSSSFPFVHKLRKIQLQKEPKYNQPGGNNAKPGEDQEIMPI